MVFNAYLVFTSSSVSTASGFKTSPKLLDGGFGRAGALLDKVDLFVLRFNICDAKSGALVADAKLELFLFLVELFVGGRTLPFCWFDFDPSVG